ncbi:6-carboxyhexanoate--CoA ligase [Fusobacterium sp. PH5-44]|uniref:6-carboxyhexanoate--CoA ligase n=1 Tax=unclassified Fusobacterium TaxID=2648384 RepID=UPI003D21FD8C
MPYSIKMRTSKYINQKEIHISGAEKIISEEEVNNTANLLIKRAISHPKGKPDFINIKIKKVIEEDILILDALKVSTENTLTPEEGRNKIIEILVNLEISNGEKILNLLNDTFSLRGAMIIDINDLQRLDKDVERGVRATNMDSTNSHYSSLHNKNHYKEAIVLATKVINAPGIIAEICISDDPDYTTGYIASKKFGYIRITNIKELGSENGGRIFLYSGNKNDIDKTIKYLEQQHVIVKNIENVNINVTKDKFEKINDEIKELKEKSLYRTLKKYDILQTSHKYIDFSSNDYLGQSHNLEIKNFVKEVIDKFPIGSSGSRLLSGNFSLHENLEEKIANFKNTESALLFNSGYIANLTTISTICDKESIIFSDELNHASIIDGCRLSGAKIIIYKHNDMTDLKEKVQFYQDCHGIIVSDAVFSMTGDICNLPEIIHIAEKYNFLSMIDEAHSTGVIGSIGKGIVEYYNLAKNPDILMGTLSKSIGSEGGYIAGDQQLIEYLKNKGRGFIFTTSLSPMVVAASIKSLEIISKNHNLINKLKSNIKLFCDTMAHNNIQTNSKTAIIPIFIGNEEKALQISNLLYESGYIVPAIRYPTVKYGEAILRISITALHNNIDIINIANKISQLIK